MNPLELAKEIIPDKPDEFLTSLIWNCTGFPAFWNIPKDGATPEECLRKQLHDAKDLMDKGISPFEEAERVMREAMLEFKEKNNDREKETPTL